MIRKGTLHGVGVVFGVFSVVRDNSRIQLIAESRAGIHGFKYPNNRPFREQLVTAVTESGRVSVVCCRRIKILRNDKEQNEVSGV